MGGWLRNENVEELEHSFGKGMQMLNMWTLVGNVYVKDSRAGIKDISWKEFVCLYKFGYYFGNICHYSGTLCDLAGIEDTDVMYVSMCFALFFLYFLT